MAKIAVVGGGASGMTAAIFAAYGGAEVTLYEKNEKLGKKIYITGKGRCNVTNNCTKQAFLENVVNGKMFMMSSASKWTSQDTMDFFADRGLELVTERGNRVFPASNKASDVTKILSKELDNLGVKVVYHCPIKSIKMLENAISLATINGFEECDAVIVACGGVSYPTTGSSGDGYKLAKMLGHTVAPAVSALNEIYTVENVSGLAGLSLKNVALSASIDNKVVASFTGEMLFTHKGISGPIALSMSSMINRLPLNKVKLYIDLKPALPHKGDTNSTVTIEARVNRALNENSNKNLSNCLISMLPVSLVKYVANLSRIDLDKKVNALTAVERKLICDLLKKLPLSVKSIADVSLGIITSGGVNTAEINPSTMQSKLCERLYFAGECMDVDAFTGGFNMQIAFSTGYVAGTSASNKYV